MRLVLRPSAASHALRRQATYVPRTPPRSLSTLAPSVAMPPKSTPSNNNNTANSPGASRLAQLAAHVAKPALAVSAAARVGGGGAPTRAFTTSAAALAAGEVSRTGGGDAGDEPKVLQLGEGAVRTILLNRPKALNALDTDMVRLVDEALDAYAQSPAPVVLLRGAGRALCSGGDIMAIVNYANSPDEAERQKSLQFFKEEFELDYKIATLHQRTGKTFVSVMDGITMGGGVGLSAHAPIRVATEKTRFAMPETGIGYFPDVGVTRHLARLDGKVGAYLGATGREIGGEEAYLAGLATHFITTANLPQALHRLTTLPASATASQVSTALDEYASDPFSAAENAEGPKKLAATPLVGERRVALDYAFGQPSAEATLSALDEVASADASSQAARELAQLGLPEVSAAVSAWARETLELLHRKSPRSIKVSLWAVAEARRFDAAEAFSFDMRLATAFCDLGVGRDFYVGVQHVLGRDPTTGKRRTGRAPWSPATMAEVDDERTRDVFFGDDETARSVGLTMRVPELEAPRRDAAAMGKEERQRRDKRLRGVGPLAWEPEHNVFALPSEAELAALVDGSHPSAGSVRLEGVEELVSVLRDAKGEKRGMRLKVDDWLARQLSRAKAASSSQ